MSIIRSPLWVAALLAAALPACSSPDHKSQGDYYVRFVKPEDNAVLSGLADVKLEISVPEEAALFEVGIEGESMSALKRVTGDLKLNTTTIANGRKTLKAQLTGESGAQWSDSIAVQIDNAAHQLVSYQLNADAYAKGEEIIMTLVYPLSGLRLDAEFTQLDDQFSKSNVTVTELGEGQYELHYVISSDDSVRPGRYEAAITATNSNAERVTTPIDLTLRSAPRLPINIEGATFVDEASVPFGAAPNAPTVSSATGANALIAGTPNNVTVKWITTDSAADRIIVRSPDYSGYYVVPVTNPSDQQASVALKLEKPNSKSSVNQKLLNLLLAAVDENGITGNWIPLSIPTLNAQSAGTLVTLWWNNPVDLDLSVTDPLGNTIEYLHNKVDGGSLEYDSNAMCILDNRNTERISWPMGAELPGTYQVTAKLYDACGQAGAHFHLLINACGKTQELEGDYSASDAKTANASRQLATFQVDCTRRAHGVVRVEQLNAIGSLSLPPAAFIPIRAISGSGSSRSVLAESITNADGTFGFYLPDSAPANYQLEAEASWTPLGATAPKAQVTGIWDTNVYRYVVDANKDDQLSAAGQTVRINVAKNAGAFNILDKMQKALFWVYGHFAAGDANKVVPLGGKWTRDADTPRTSTYYESNAINISGARLLRDEYDDSVIAHEVMHHVSHCLGANTSPNGEHKFEQRYVPSLAWEEGQATALGQQALGDPTYRDIDGANVTMVQLEDRARFSGIDSARGADLGTEHGKMSDKLSEILVSAVLWDLMDPPGDANDSQDVIDSTYPQTLGAIARYLPAHKWTGRGASGIDLVDFLDGWRCQWPTVTSKDKDLKKLLNERQFLYDYQESIKCR